MNHFYQESKVELLGEIPDHWRIYGFKQVFKLIYRYPTYYNIEYIPEGVPEVRGAALSKEGLINKLDSERYISAETNENFPRTQLTKGDIVMTVRGTMGKIGLVDSRYNGANITANLLRLSPKTRVADGCFLKWQFLSEYFSQNLDATSPQTTIKTVTIPQLTKIRLPLPSLEEQIIIRAYLDKTCAAIDKTIEAKQKQLEILDALRKSIIHKAVTRGLDDSVELKDSGVVWLGRIPSTWHSQRIKDVTKLSPGFSAGKPTIADLCTVIPMEAVSKNGEISTDQGQEFNSISDGLTNFEVGDIIFAKITPCMENGKGAYITALPTKYAFESTEFHVLRPSDKVDGKFLYYYTFNSVYRKYAEKNMTGAAGQKRVSSNFLKYTRIYLPDVMTQRHIADYLDEKCSELTELQANIVAQISTLEKYRKSLIHECVTGKQRITEDDVQGQL